MKKHLYIALLSFLVLLAVGTSPSLIRAQTKQYTLEELKQFDGREGRKAYYAFEGKVYDVTGSKLWEEGEHFGLFAGEDLTGKLEGAPHGTEVFAGFEVIGTYGMPAESTVTGVPAQLPPTSVKPEWYETRIKFWGYSILGWTGIFLGIFFVLTFATCFAMPWAKLPLPWAGTRPGDDALDVSPKHMTWSYIHKYFVWVTVILGVVHGLIGFLQMLGVFL